MIPTYASFRQSLPSSVFTVAVISAATTDASAGVLSVYISAENRAGLNQLSEPKTLTIGSGQGIAVTILESAIAPGEDSFWIVISLSKTDNDTDAVRVAAIKTKEDDQVTRRSLPITIELTTDEHFNLSRTVVDFNSLPNAGILDGAIAAVADSGSYYKYNSEAFADGDNYSSYGTYVSGANNWVRYYGTDSTYIADTKTFVTVPGSDRALKSIEYALTIPPKIGDADSTPILYWLNNGYLVDGQSPIVNGSYTFEVRINGVDYSGVYSGHIKYTLLGYVDRATGELDTSIDTVGDLKVWTPTDTIKLPSDLPRNHAALYSVYLSYAVADIAGKLPTSTPSIQLNIVSVGGVSGKLSPIANTLGNTVQADRGKLLIVPGATRLSGIATIKMPGTQGYLIDTDGTQPLNTLLDADTDNQVAAIAGSLNGLITIRKQGEALAYSERVRAYISTLPGISNLSVVSTEVTLNNEGIKITVTHPINLTEQGIVRSDYPDRFLAGNPQGQFTATKGGLILDIDGVIWQQINTTAVNATATEPNQEFDIADLSGFSIVATLPVQSDPAFSLFEPMAIAIIANSAGTINGVVKAYYYYSYESPNITATKIRHDLPGTVSTLTVDLGESFEQVEEAVAHKNDLGNPHLIDVLKIGAATQADMDVANTNIADNRADTDVNITDIDTIENTIATYGTTVTTNLGLDTGNVAVLENNGDGRGVIPSLPRKTITENANFTATPNVLTKVDTSGGEITATIPSTVAINDWFWFVDKVGSDKENPTGFGNNAFHINPGTKTTQGYSGVIDVDTENAIVWLQYDGISNLNIVGGQV